MDYSNQFSAFGVGPLAETIGFAPEPTMWWWQGTSGFWYVHSIVPFSLNIGFDNANYIFVRREFNGLRTALYIGQSDKLSARLPTHEKVAGARRLGVNELHVHLLATSDSERIRIETDVRNGHKTPLNDQGTPYFTNALAALLQRPRG